LEIKIAPVSRGNFNQSIFTLLPVQGLQHLRLSPLIFVSYVQ
jgi:hypothetical protein